MLSTVYTVGVFHQRRQLLIKSIEVEDEVFATRPVLPLMSSSLLFLFLAPSYCTVFRKADPGWQKTALFRTGAPGRGITYCSIPSR